MAVISVYCADLPRAHPRSGPAGGALCATRTREPCQGYLLGPFCRTQKTEDLSEEPWLCCNGLCFHIFSTNASPANAVDVGVCGGGEVEINNVRHVLEVNAPGHTVFFIFTSVDTGKTHTHTHTHN